MTAPAGAVIESARPAIERLARSRDAASLVGAWTAIEAALQTAATNPSLTGQGLVRDLRQRNVLSLDQGHALIELLAAHDRAAVPGYAVTDADVQAARDALDQLAAAPPPPTPIPAVPAAPTSAPIPVTQGQIGIGKVLGFLVLLVVVAGAAAYGVVLLRRGRAAPAASVDLMSRGIATYQAGHVDSARVYFEHAAAQDTTNPMPHIYLGRIAREAGDLTTARNELVTAVRLGPTNEVAQREMGGVLLAARQYDLARKFYARAVALDSTDHAALGFYGCTLKRLGQAQDAAQYLTRAGQGPWTACQ